jgi:hypothetical protein
MNDILLLRDIYRAYRAFIGLVITAGVSVADSKPTRSRVEVDFSRV